MVGKREGRMMSELAYCLRLMQRALARSGDRIVDANRHRYEACAKSLAQRLFSGSY